MRATHAMSEAAGLLTAEELERFPSDDYRYELVEGRIVRMSPIGYQHGLVVARLLSRLVEHLRNRRGGVALTEVGFVLATRPDTVRAPDISFIRPERMLPPDTRGFFRGAPDAAIEVLSPEDRPSDVRTKVDEYFSSGVPLVVVLDPRVGGVRVFRRLVPPVSLRRGEDLLDLGDVIPGFHCTLREIFE